MFSNNFRVTGSSNYRTIAQTPGHIANITEEAATAGINMVSSKIESMIPIFGNIVEHALGEGRVIVFHKSHLLNGIASAYPDVIIMGEKEHDVELHEGDGEYIAEYLNANPNQSVFIDLGHMDEKVAARIIGDFANKYAKLRKRNMPAELISLFGFNRILMRRRHHTGDTEAVQSLINLQMLAADRNMRFIHASSALSEVPIEFHTNTPNMLVFNLASASHCRDIARHLPDDISKEVINNMNNEECGVLHVGTGYATYFNPSDLPHDHRQKFPYIIEEEKLRSKIGQPYNGQGSKKNRKALYDFIKSRRKERREDEEKAEAESMRKHVIKQVKAKLMRRQIEEDVIAQLQFSGIALTRPLSNGAGQTVAPVVQQKVKNSIAEGGSLYHKYDDEGLSYASLRARVVFMLSAYRITNGRTIMGQQIPMEVLDSVHDEVKDVIPEYAKKLKSNPLMMVTAIVLGNEGDAYIEFIMSNHPTAESARIRAETLSSDKKKTQGISNDKIFATLIQAWNAYKNGNQVKRFSSKMPANLIADNDTAPIKAAA